MKVKTLRFATCLFLFLTFLGTACSNETADTQAPAASTIDSNTVNQGDSIPAILHLDNADDTTFPVALDSLGPTVDAVDTSGGRR